MITSRYPDTLVGLYEDSAARHASQSAVVHASATLTYGQIESRANQIARVLIGAGVLRGHLVAVLLDRGPSLYCALLGILKTGAAFVPLDSRFPAERCEWILRETECPFLITEGRYASAATGYSGTVLILDHSADGAGHHRGTAWSERIYDDAVQKMSVDAPGLEISPRDLAYVMFTSGSSGRPKGVLVEHRSVTNVAKWAKDAFAIGPDSRVAQTYSLAFDASMQEIFGALGAGATLFPISQSRMLSPRAVVEYIRDNAISHCDMVPTYWYEIVRRVASEAVNTSPVLPSLRALMLGGERIRPEAVVTWLKHMRTDHRIYNQYGPTEATVTATCHEISLQDAESGMIPIGQPIPNVSIHVLADGVPSLKPGTVGEIAIGGVGLARGYLNDPESTAQAFVTTAMCGQPTRLYRTGDIGRILDQGRGVEFLGRMDEQVSWRGLRIELGEIEAAARTCPGVRDCVVIAHRANGTNEVSWLEACYTDDGSIVSPSTVQAHVRKVLPAFMLPTRFRRCTEFPLTTSGKVDRVALREELLKSSQ